MPFSIIQRVGLWALNEQGSSWSWHSCDQSDSKTHHAHCCHALSAKGHLTGMQNSSAVSLYSGAPCSLTIQSARTSGAGRTEAAGRVNDKSTWSSASNLSTCSPQAAITCEAALLSCRISSSHMTSRSRGNTKHRSL